MELKEFFKDMIIDIKKTFKPIYKYLRFFILIILFFISSIFKLIPIYIFDLDINNLSSSTQSLLTLFSNFILVILSILLYFKDIKKHFINIKKTKKKKLVIMLDTSFRYWLIGLAIMVVSNFIIGKLGIGTSANDTSVINMLESSPIVAGISVILLAPFIEEMVFRMGFKDVLNKKWLFILTSGIIFGSIHVIGSISSAFELLYLIPYCGLGIAFAAIYEESDNIFISFLFHVLHNSLTAFTAFLLAGVILW